MSATHTEASGDELDDILIHGTIWNTRLEPGSNDWPKLVVNPEAKHKLHSLMVRERIEELKKLKDSHPIVSGFHADCHICKFVDERIAALEAQLLEQEAEK